MVKMNIKKSNEKLYQIILLMILCGTLVVANVLFTMVTHRHFWSGEDALESKISSSIVSRNVPAKRGNIYDRNFCVIAQDVKAYTIVAHLDKERVDENGKPDYVSDPRKTARKLKRILEDDVDEKSVRNILEDCIREKIKYTELGPGTKRLDKEVKEKIEKENIPGIEFIEDRKREYPTTPFSSSMVGFATYDEEEQKIVGKMGLEQTLDDELSGEDGKVCYQQTSNGIMLPGTKKESEAAKPGNDVVLTIDGNLQSIVEQQLKSTMELNDAKMAWAISVEIETGRVLAWGSYPTFDQNKHQDIPTYIDNMATMQIEPGSVMKPFVYATAIDTGVYPRGKSYVAGQFTYDVDSTGKIVRIGNGGYSPYPPILDALGTDFGTLTFEQGLAVSSNIAICELLANYINYHDFGNYLDAFGFFSPIDSIHVPQVNGVKNVLNASDYLSTGFGQGSSITLLQMVQAYTAIFNDGKMMRPYVVESIENMESGEVIEDMEPKEVGRPISEETAHEVCDILRGVTGPGGTGERFKIDGIDMLMKTGTGEIYNEEEGRYDTTYYTSSAIGAAPADNPKIMVFWGMVSSNIIGYSELPFQTIMQASLATSGISGSNQDVGLHSQESGSNEGLGWSTYEMPSFLNHSKKYVKEHMKDMDVKVEWIGDGNTVLNQYPLAGTTVYSNDRVFFMTNSNKLVMPDMSGWTRKDIMAFSQLTGIDVKITGNGKVVKQNISAKDKISKKSDIKLTLE